MQHCLRDEQHVLYALVQISEQSLDLPSGRGSSYLFFSSLAICADGHPSKLPSFKTLGSFFTCSLSKSNEVFARKEEEKEEVKLPSWNKTNRRHLDVCCSDREALLLLFFF